VAVLQADVKCVLGSCIPAADTGDDASLIAGGRLLVESAERVEKVVWSESWDSVV